MPKTITHLIAELEAQRDELGDVEVKIEVRNRFEGTCLKAPVLRTSMVRPLSGGEPRPVLIFL